MCADCKKDNDLTTYLCVKRLHSARHAVRMSDNKIPKLIMEGNLAGKKAHTVCNVLCHPSA